jgi:hypothetical protein
MHFISQLHTTHCASRMLISAIRRPRAQLAVSVVLEDKNKARSQWARNKQGDVQTCVEWDWTYRAEARPKLNRGQATARLLWKFHAGWAIARPLGHAGAYPHKWHQLYNFEDMSCAFAPRSFLRTLILPALSVRCVCGQLRMLLYLLCRIWPCCFCHLNHLSPLESHLVIRDRTR